MAYFAPGSAMSHVNVFQPIGKELAPHRSGHSFKCSRDVYSDTEEQMRKKKYYLSIEFSAVCRLFTQYLR